MNLPELQKKGQGKMSASIYGLVATVIVIILVSALAPDVFTNLLNVNTTSGAPAWVGTVLTVLSGAAFVFIIWRAATSK